MIPLHELRIGNKVFWNPKFVQSNAAEQLPVEISDIMGDKIGCVSPHLEHRVEFFDDGLEAPKVHYESADEIAPVPITSEWILIHGRDLNYPVWIKYVHELQNWYFWHHEKTELLPSNA